MPDAAATVVAPGDLQAVNIAPTSRIIRRARLAYRRALRPLSL
jgi:hypothetical protein